MQFSNAYFIGSLRTGGAESAVRNVVLGLSEAAKARVCVILLNDKNSDEYSSQIGVPVYNLNASGVIDAAFKLKKISILLNIKRIHAHLAQCVISAGLSTLLLNIEVVCYIHTYGRWKRNVDFRGGVLIFLERYVCNRIAEKVVYVSDGIKESHLKNLGYRSDNAMVIPNPLSDFGALAKNFDGKTLNIITVGRLEKVKGIDWVVDAPWFKKFFSIHTWTVVGNGTQFASLERKIRQHGNVNVVMLGARSDVAQLLARHCVFLLPSHSEGLSVAILEAMRAGLPIVCTDVGSNREMVKDGVNGFVVPVGSHEHLLNAFTVLLDSSVRQKMGEESVKIFAENYSPIVILQKLEGLLK